MKKALITGVTGQDGSYLSEFLLAKGYEVHGLIRRSSSFNTGRLMHLIKDPQEASTFFLQYGDLSDASSLEKLIDKIGPDEIYNLGAQSHVRVSFDHPLYTADIVASGALRLFEAVKNTGRAKVTRIYQAGSSEMFGKSPHVPQNEVTPFYPRSPYACAKVFAHHQAVNYREAYGMHISNGILFNHESPRRGETFVTRKITRGLARILAGQDKKIYLGNLDAKRDWGYAKDYVEAMWLMLQQERPDDYVIATGESHSVREFLQLAFACVGLQFEDFVGFDARHMRPTEVDELRGDAAKARTKLGWQPRTAFRQLVEIMVREDLKQYGVEDRFRGLEKR